MWESHAKRSIQEGRRVTNKTVGRGRAGDLGEHGDLVGAHPRQDFLAPTAVR